MMKVTALYHHPKSLVDSERYYSDTHLPIAARMQGLERLELTKFIGAPDGGPAAYWRMAELYFASEAAMKKTLSSPEGQATLSDIPNFATGGVTVIVGTVDK